MLRRSVLKTLLAVPFLPFLPFLPFRPRTERVVRMVNGNRLVDTYVDGRLRSVEGKMDISHLVQVVPSRPNSGGPGRPDTP